MPGGNESQRDVVIHPGAVGVVALDDQGRVMLIKQYRHPVKESLWELPAGLMDVEGELALTTAQRELGEEAGLQANTWNVLVDVLTSPGMTDEATRIYLARDISDTGNERSDEDEEADLELAWVDLDEALRSVLSGGIRNCPRRGRHPRRGAGPRPGTSRACARSRRRGRTGSTVPQIVDRKGAARRSSRATAQRAPRRDTTSGVAAERGPGPRSTPHRVLRQPDLLGRDLLSRSYWAGGWNVAKIWSRSGLEESQADSGVCQYSAWAVRPSTTPRFSTCRSDAALGEGELPVGGAAAVAAVGGLHPDPLVVRDLAREARLVGAPVADRRRVGLRVDLDAHQAALVRPGSRSGRVPPPSAVEAGRERDGPAELRVAGRSASRRARRRPCRSTRCCRSRSMSSPTRTRPSSQGWRRTRGRRGPRSARSSRRTGRGRARRPRRRPAREPSRSGTRRRAGELVRGSWRPGENPAGAATRRRAPWRARVADVRAGPADVLADAAGRLPGGPFRLAGVGPRVDAVAGVGTARVPGSSAAPSSAVAAVGGGSGAAAPGCRFRCYGLRSGCCGGDGIAGLVSGRRVGRTDLALGPGIRLRLRSDWLLGRGVGRRRLSVAGAPKRLSKSQGRSPCAVSAAAGTPCAGGRSSGRRGFEHRRPVRGVGGDAPETLPAGRDGCSAGAAALRGADSAGASGAVRPARGGTSGETVGTRRPGKTVAAAALPAPSDSARAVDCSSLRPGVAAGVAAPPTGPSVRPRTSRSRRRAHGSGCRRSSSGPARRDPP